MSFPTSPTNGQQITLNGITYTYASATRSWRRNTLSNVSANYGSFSGNVTANNYIISGTGIFYSNGTAYSSGGGATYTANTAPPASGNVSGDQWYNTSTDILYEYQYDGTSYYWIDVTSPSIGNSSAGTTFTGTEGTFTTKVTTSNLAVGPINANSTVTVAELTSNGAVTGTTGTFTTKVTTSNLAVGPINANANATVAGLTVNANATISGNITASYFLGNGSQLTGITGGVTSVSAGNGISVSGTTAVTVSLDIYTGTTYNETSYPIGTYRIVYFGAGRPSMNADVTLYSPYPSDTCILRNSQPSGSLVMAGTWKACGAEVNTQIGMAQRIA